MKVMVLSHVMPYPGKVGQQQRVANKLRAFREVFEVSFLTVAGEGREERLSTWCDEVILMPPAYGRNTLTRAVHHMRGRAFALGTGLKASNYAIGRVEFSPERVAAAAAGKQAAGVVYEYWHAAASTAVFRERGVPTILDMHDVLWQSYQRQLAAKNLPEWWTAQRVRLYKQAEEAAWHQFDALIAINEAEADYARSVVGPGKPIFYAPMGADLDTWGYGWHPAEPVRVAYYGGLGSPHNQRDAMLCYEHIMPRVWEDFPAAELWIVGSNPPEHIRAVGEDDARVTVTGFVDDVQAVLGTMSVVLCPWEGTYGFRSRLVEVMAVGVPVIASPDAVYGMAMEEGRGIYLREQAGDMADTALMLLGDEALLGEQSRLARKQMEEKYSFDATYGKLARDLHDYLTG